MERHVLLVLLLKDGMELNVSTDVIQVKFGILLLNHVCAPLDNSGMDTLVLSVQMEKHGALTLNLANVQSHQPGMESLALSVLQVESITMSPINANVQLVSHSMVLFALLTVQQVNFITKP